MQRNYEAAAMNGRIVQVSVMKGPAQNLNLWRMLNKRLTHIGSTLRSRSYADKAGIIADLRGHVWPLIAQGTLKPVVHKTFALENARGAHELLDSAQHVGKVILVTDALDENPHK